MPLVPGTDRVFLHICIWCIVQLFHPALILKWWKLQVASNLCLIKLNVGTLHWTTPELPSKELLTLFLPLDCWRVLLMWLNGLERSSQTAKHTLTKLIIPWDWLLELMIVIVSYVSVLHIQCDACDDRMCCLPSTEHCTQVYHASPYVSCICSLDTRCLQRSFQ